MGIYLYTQIMEEDAEAVKRQQTGFASGVAP